MPAESVFRWAFGTILVATFTISIAFRRRARQSGETIPRSREGAGPLAARMLVAAPLYFSMLAYLIDPRWISWAALPLGTGVRWAGVGLGLAMLPLLIWVMASLGRNISETFLTKDRHELVTHGPYRWVRHPLYTVASLILLALGAVAANGFILGMALLAFGAIARFVVPREEAELLRKFGEEYRRYQRTTGRFGPRLLRRG